MASRERIAPGHDLALSVSEDPCGVAYAKVEADGQQVATYRTATFPKIPLLLVAPRRRWGVGRHRWKVTSRDKLGNSRVSQGSFYVGKRSSHHRRGRGHDEEDGRIARQRPRAGSTVPARPDPRDGTLSADRHRA